MGGRLGSPSRVRTSEDKVRRKDLCVFVRAVYVLKKLLDVSGPGLVEVGHYKRGPWVLSVHPLDSGSTACLLAATCSSQGSGRLRVRSGHRWTLLP
jgi:hypothetical protein